MKYRQKPPVVEAITFAEFVEHGKAYAGANLVNGIPWSFAYGDAAVTHENDDCYLLFTRERKDSNGADTQQRFERGDMLVTDAEGKMRVLKPDVFAVMYEVVPPRTSEAP